MEALLRPTGAAPASAASAASAATGRAHGVAPAAAEGRGAGRSAPPTSLLRIGARIATSPNLQGDVARAQQALDYLERVAGQLEALKSDLGARLAGRGAASQALEARARQLAATLEGRRQQAGDGVDARLEFAPEGAAQRFRIRGLDIATLSAGASQTLGFSVGSAGGPQLAATIEPDSRPEDIARRLDRTLAPLQVRAGLDQDRELVFTTREATYGRVKDAIAVTGRGRVDTAALPTGLAPENWELGDPDALRQGLREVVQALARVRRSQEAAALALSAAMARTHQSAMPAAELAAIADDFAATAAGHDYASLLAITSALAGVSRERVHALLALA